MLKNQQMWPAAAHSILSVWREELSWEWKSSASPGNGGYDFGSAGQLLLYFNGCWQTTEGSHQVRSVDQVAPCKCTGPAHLNDIIIWYCNIIFFHQCKKKKKKSIFIILFSVCLCVLFNTMFNCKAVKKKFLHTWKKLSCSLHLPV